VPAQLATAGPHSPCPNLHVRASTNGRLCVHGIHPVIGLSRKSGPAGPHSAGLVKSGQIGAAVSRRRKRPPLARARSCRYPARPGALRGWAGRLGRAGPAPPHPLAGESCCSIPAAHPVSLARGTSLCAAVLTPPSSPSHAAQSQNPSRCPVHRCCPAAATPLRRMPPHAAARCRPAPHAAICTVAAPRAHPLPRAQHCPRIASRHTAHALKRRTCAPVAEQSHTSPHPPPRVLAPAPPAPGHVSVPYPQTTHPPAPPPNHANTDTRQAITVRAGDSARLRLRRAGVHCTLALQSLRCGDAGLVGRIAKDHSGALLIHHIPHWVPTTLHTSLYCRDSNANMRTFSNVT
jgi:hypothetical protein